MATALGDTIAYGDQDFLARREFVYCNVDLHGGVQWLHPYVLMQAVVELRSMFTVRDVPLAPHHQVIRQGDPGEQILKYADDIDAELIVMGSHGRSDGLGLMLGSASQRVVDNAPCPVLVARIQSARNR